jgi:hypothetical protein
MGFIFLRAIVVIAATIGGVFVARHLVIADEKASVGTFYVTSFLEEASELIGEAVLPNGLVFVGLH